MLVHAPKATATGVPAIDRDHEMLLSMVEIVRRAAVDGDRRRAASMLDRTIRLAESHSRDEEDFLRRGGFNNVLDLRRDHEMMIVFLEDLRAACDADDGDRLPERVGALSEFMAAHFAMECEALRRFLRHAA